MTTESEEKTSKSEEQITEPCKHKWQWRWIKGIWTNERICATCGIVEKCGK